MITLTTEEQAEYKALRKANPNWKLSHPSNDKELSDTVAYVIKLRDDMIKAMIDRKFDVAKTIATELKMLHHVYKDRTK